MNYNDALKHCIFRYVSGSNAYGTNTPESDEDIRGVFIAPLESNFDLFKTSFVGHGTIREHLTTAVTAIEECNYNTALERLLLAQLTDEGDLNNSVGTVCRPGCDEELHELRKFFKLAASSNPHIIEMFGVNRLILIETDEWKLIKKHKDLFISKKARYTFSGYAMTQMHKIRLHRGYLLNPPKKQPQRSDFGLSETSIIPKISLNAILTIGDEYLVDNIKEVVKNEKRYHEALKNWNAYCNWEKNRNPKRKEMERKYGFDLKHSAHLVRLAKMCKEILIEKEIHVFRHDREELKAILNGEWTFDQVEAVANNLDNELDEIYKKSTLRDAPDHYGISELYKEICMKKYGVKF